MHQEKNNKEAPQVVQSEGVVVYDSELARKEFTRHIFFGLAFFTYSMMLYLKEVQHEEQPNKEETHLLLALIIAFFSAAALALIYAVHRLCSKSEEISSVVYPKTRGNEAPLETTPPVGKQDYQHTQVVQRRPKYLETSH